MSSSWRATPKRFGFDSGMPVGAGINMFRDLEAASRLCWRDWKNEQRQGQVSERRDLRWKAVVLVAYGGIVHPNPYPPTLGRSERI
jgi:hypothetical protein